MVLFAQGGAGRCRHYVVAATRFPPPLRLETISVRSGPGPVCENLRLSLPSPAITCPGEVGGINCGGDMGVRRCLARSLTSLALLRTPKSENSPRSNSFRPDSPLTTTSNRGRKTQTDSPTTPDMVRFGRVLPTSVKSPIKIQPSPRLNCYSLSSY